MVDLLDGQAGISWRNFSVPWYDPAMDTNTPEGARYVLHNLEQQVRPADAMLLLMDVYSVKSARKWVDLEIDFAKQHGIPIVAVGNTDDTTDEMLNLAQIGNLDVDWNGQSIVAKLAEIRQAKSEGHPKQ
jgi:hypothetical protein